MNYIDKLLQGKEVEWKTLGEIAEIYGGLTGKSKADFEKGNAKYVSYKNIFANIEVDFNKLENVEVSANERQNEVKYGDILFTGSSEIANEAGMSSAVTIKFDEKVYLNSFSFGLRFNGDIEIIPEFAKYLFRVDFMRKEIAKTASGVTRFNVSKARFKKIQIPIPPLEVQQEIVAILDKFTELTAELIAGLNAELTTRKKQYAYYREELFRFEGKEVEWKSLGEVAENLDALRKPVKSDSRDLGDIPYYGASGIVDYVKDYIFDGDFLLVSEDGANLIARSTPIAFSISGKSWVNNHAHILKFENKSQRKLVEYYLNSIDLEPYITGAAQPKLSQKNLNKIKVPVIARVFELESLVHLLDQLDEATKNIVAALEKEIALRNKQYEYYRNQLLGFNG